MTGSITDTYVAALQHGLVDLEDGTRLIGVVRQPTRWFNPQVDENIAELGPPLDLFEEFQDRRDDLIDAGYDEAAAHNAAWTDVDYDDRYRHHLETSEAASGAVEALIDRVRQGSDIALVCFENTDEKRCHRTTLREYLQSRTPED